MNDSLVRQGAIVGTRDGNAREVLGAIAAVLTELGYRRAPTDAIATQRDAVLVHVECASGAWARGSLDAITTRELSRRLAARVSRTVWAFTARVDLRVEEPTIDASEWTVTPAGAFERALPSVLAEIDGRERDLSDDKPQVLVEASLDVAWDLWVEADEPGERIVWLAPVPLSSPRLEALAAQLRAGAKAEQVTMMNRRALRIRANDGSVSTAFLSDEELRALTEAFPALG